VVPARAHQGPYGTFPLACRIAFPKEEPPGGVYTEEVKGEKNAYTKLPPRVTDMTLRTS
jgi:hypothetical protein